MPNDDQLPTYAITKNEWERLRTAARLLADDGERITALRTTTKLVGCIYPITDRDQVKW